MKKILIALLVCFSFVTANAKDYSKYYQNLPVQMQQPTLPSIPANHVSILECGGNGDGLTMNIQAFAKAIRKLKKWVAVILMCLQVSILQVSYH